MLTLFLQPVQAHKLVVIWVEFADIFFLIEKHNSILSPGYCWYCPKPASFADGLNDMWMCQLLLVLCVYQDNQKAQLCNSRACG